MKLKETLQIEKEKLSHMSFKDKMWYIWEYYKFHMLIGLFILFILSAVGTSIYDSTIETELHCIVLNSPRSQENFGVITEEFSQAMGYGKKQEIYVESMVSSYGEGQGATSDYTTVMKMSTLIAAAELDMLICDQEGFDYYGRMDAYADLTTLLPADLLETVEDRICYAQTEDGRQVAAGIDLTDTWFAEAVDLTMETPYLCVMINSARTDTCVDLIRYIFSR